MAKWPQITCFVGPCPCNQYDNGVVGYSMLSRNSHVQRSFLAYKHADRQALLKHPFIKRWKGPRPV